MYPGNPTGRGCNTYYGRMEFIQFKKGEINGRVIYDNSRHIPTDGSDGH